MKLMFLTPHAVAGIVIAAKIQNPFLAIILAFFSHFVLDAIPHWTTSITNLLRDKKAFVVLLIDSFLSLGLGLFFAFREGFSTSKFWLILICAGMAILPDAMRIPFYFFHCRSRFFQGWENIHISIDQDVRRNTLFFGKKTFGILTQMLAILLLFWLLLS
ncbi:hypothetical protein COS81_03620 [candidate division WWE3 bacterium CG06_land_8_20_14_3_00_42_16]|uniref:DUF3307 domain-containing protein n=3 Tax=Katanobacteria TaxID=422282 RepID=A0A2M7AMB2_UNCKA|nr:MAG: hypothetical protein COS81_03620 [candidate division WWE3 bacterium CG06_land_8_20_14_3_00_42_16]